MKQGEEEKYVEQEQQCMYGEQNEQGVGMLSWERKVRRWSRRSRERKGSMLSRDISICIESSKSRQSRCSREVGRA